MKLYLLFLAVCPALSLFEDQIGSSDWRQEFVGSVSYVSVDQSGRGDRWVVVASETGVLAVLDPQDGHIVWRQLFEQSGIDVVLRSEYGSLLSVSHHGQLLRSWDIGSGQLKYEVPTSLPSSPPDLSDLAPLYQNWRPGGILAALAGKKGGLVAVASRSKVIGFASRNGDVKWTFSADAGSVVCAVSGEKDRVRVLTSADGEALHVLELNSSNGALLASHHLPAPWLHTDTVHCLLSGQRVWCVDRPHVRLYSAELADTPSFHPHSLHTLLHLDTPIPISLLPAPDQEGVWLHVGPTHWLLTLQSGDVVVSSEFVGVAWRASPGGSDEEWDVRLEATEDELTLVHHHGDGEREVGGVYALDVARGRPVQASVHLYTNSDQSVAAQVAVVMEDDSILMLAADGWEDARRGVEWAREEGLGRISTLQFMDMPPDQPAMVQSFLEQTRAELNPIKLALLRWQLQAQLLKEFFGALQRGDFTSLLLRSDSTELVRDQFSTRKMIVAVTSGGKVYGLDSNDGGVVWQHYFPWLHPFSGGSPLLYILRSTSHPLHPPLAVLIGRSKHPSCPRLCLVAFNPLTGPPSEGPPTLCLPELLQTLLLHKEDRNHSKILLMLTSDLEVISYPASPEVTFHLTELNEQLFFYVADKQEGKIDGYYINNERSPSSELLTFHTSHLWHLSFPNATERLVDIIAKPVNEHVSAVGRSRVDRSIQYKYLNPNLITVVTESTDPLRPAVSVYLVDVVTGGVVFHTSHKAAVAPVHLVHSENWIVYQFLNSKLRRHELVILELYERDSNQSRVVWSSVTPPPPPQVMTQAYTVPNAFVTIATTQTRRGITAKNILVGLKSGHIAAIPKTVLDPRRQVEATDDMKEFGLPPYAPQLELRPQIFINYNKTVGGLRNIYSTSSGLESTSLVLACGLDLYFTRVLPSKQFDLLAVDFDYYLIAAVVVAMVTATIILAKLSAGKSLKLLWK